MSKDITPTGSICPVFLDPTPDEQVAIDKIEYDIREVADNKAIAQAKIKADARTSALAKLAKLGLTKAEIEAL